jgi:hypothetical protein
VIHICQYLCGTKDKGKIYKPTKKLEFDCYVNTDFAGLWTHEDPFDPSCVKSRLGWVVSVAGCPAFW